jgi:hypothetical protein
MTDVISSGRENRAPEHVIDLFIHYDERDEPAVLHTVLGMSHAAAMAPLGHDRVGWWS